MTPPLVCVVDASVAIKLYLAEALATEAPRALTFCTVSSGVGACPHSQQISRQSGHNNRRHQSPRHNFSNRKLILHNNLQTDCSVNLIVGTRVAFPTHLGQIGAA